MSNTTIAKHARENHQFFTIAGHEVPGVNCPQAWAVDACAYLCEMHQNAPFAAAYVRETTGWRFWLFSPGRMDVGDIAYTLRGSGSARLAEFVVQGGPRVPFEVGD